jgi:hypothetical protein
MSFFQDAQLVESIDGKGFLQIYLDARNVVESVKSLQLILWEGLPRLSKTKAHWSPLGRIVWVT